MENTQLPPSTPSPKQTGISEEPNLPPGTFTYVDKKKKWKITLEIVGLLIILAIPVTLSLYKVNYRFKHIYEAINPAYIPTSASPYQTWGGFINAAQKFIQPVIAPIQPTITPTPTPLPTPLPTPIPTAIPVNNLFPNQPPTQSTGQSSGAPQSQTQQQFIYPTQPLDQPITYPTDTPTPTPTPLPLPTSTPTPTQVPWSSGQSSQSVQPPPNPAVVACYGKKNGDNCFYSASDNQVHGQCWTSAGILFCTGN